jgi:1-acyl-sn-glycerol-3-phosphate acyltransferase
MPVQWAVLKAGWSSAGLALPLVYHRVCCRILGLHIDVRGVRSAVRPTLFIANHLSYLDIEVLGALIPGSFVAKMEVGGWPFFGSLARLQRTVFVDRRIGSAGRQRDDIRDRLAAGGNLVLFPEGTSTDGNRTLPFKSALFAVADIEIDGRALMVQPVSLACTAMDGIPLGRRLRSVYAWYGDMELGPHLWTMLKQGRVTVTVIFHPPVTVRSFGSRKALAEHCGRMVAAGLSAANAGRLVEPVAPSARAA